MVPEEDQKLIDAMVKGEEELEHLSAEDSALYREVLADIVGDYLQHKHTPEEIREFLKKKREFIAESLRDILLLYDFSEESAERKAAHIAKIIEDDIELETDAVAAEDEEYARHEPIHENDDRAHVFGEILIKHPQIGRVLEIMVDEPEKLAALAPEGKAEEYCKEFNNLLNEYLRHEKSGAEWELSPTVKKFLIEFMAKFARRYLRADTKKREPA